MSTGMFYYWKKKLSASVEQSSFLEVEVPSLVGHTPVIEVHFGMGKLIRIEGQVSPEFLRDLLQC